MFFCDDFSENNTDNWDLYPATNNELVPDGVFDLVNDNGNYILRHTSGTTSGVIALVKSEELSGLTSSDYYVEAKIRPRNNSSVANKQLYLLGRYQDGNNWYAGALNVQNSVSSTQVEIAVMKDGQLSRIKQVKAQIEQGAEGDLDGQWYNLRFVMKGDTLTVYLDGDLIATTTDGSFSTAGLIGLWTANKSFEIDDIKVGNADDIPASFVLSPKDTDYIAEVGDDPSQVSAEIAGGYLLHVQSCQTLARPA